jgi:MFS transporter, FHS family, L-fucose permease
MSTRSHFMVVLVLAIFFVISFLTNILGALVPDIITGFKVSFGMAALLPFSFFIAYGVMSIPAGFLAERCGDKALMIGSFLLGTAGALSFALLPTFAVAAGSLFVMGGGMAALQVVVNPLLRVAGGEEHFAFNSALAQLVFGCASFISPYVYSYLVTHLSEGSPQASGVLRILASVTPRGLAWVSIYWLFALATAVMAFLIIFIRMPRVIRSADESAGTPTMYITLLRNPVIWAYFLSVLAYVGSEQGTADWISQFLYRYHGLDPHVAGAAAVAWFWGLLTAGCLIGLLLLKLFDSRHVLIGFSLGALLMLTLGLFGPTRVAVVAFPCIGLFASIMWPTIVSLALNSVPRHHGPFAGILCTGIMGGALVPLLIGQIGDAFGLRAGMAVLYLTFGCVLSVGLWARPLIPNALLGGREITVS